MNTYSLSINNRSQGQRLSADAAAALIAAALEFLPSAAIVITTTAGAQQ